MRYITVALAKGRLADRAMEYFSRIGCPCEEMKDKKTNAAKCGVVRKHVPFDTILELYQKMIVA